MMEGGPARALGAIVAVAVGAALVGACGTSGHAGSESSGNATGTTVPTAAPATSSTTAESQQVRSALAQVFCTSAMEFQRDVLIAVSRPDLSSTQKAWFLLQGGAVELVSEAPSDVERQQVTPMADDLLKITDWLNLQTSAPRASDVPPTVTSAVQDLKAKDSELASYQKAHCSTSADTGP